MLVSRWWLLGLLAVVAAATAAPQESISAVTSDKEPEYQEYVFEETKSETELDEPSNELGEFEMEEPGEFGRGVGKSIGKAVGKGFKKVIKVTGKGLKVLGKGAKKGLKVVGKGVGKVGFKIAKGAAKGILKGGKIVGKGMIKVTKATKKFVTKKGKKIWGSLKTKLNGELGKAGKKLLKAIGKQVLEVGVSIAVEALAPMVMEYVMQETQDRLCTCEENKCSCCAQPPGFEKGCLVLRVRPKLQFINAAVTYGGKELARVNITTTESPQSCKRLEGYAKFITACIEPLGLGELENGFRGCLNINIEPLKIEREMCVDFTGSFKNGTSKWVPVNELDEVEIMVEGDEAE